MDQTKLQAPSEMRIRAIAEAAALAVAKNASVAPQLCFPHIYLAIKAMQPDGWQIVPAEPTPDMLHAYDDYSMTTRAIYQAMLAAAPAAPAAPAPSTWSSATAPGPDGMQHCIAVPGMPSAARDAAYDEIAALAVQWGDARVPEGGGNALRNFAEYVLARKSIATPAPSLPAPSAWIDQFGNTFPLAAYSVDGKPNYHDQHKRGWAPLYRATPAPVQQAAPSAILAWEERLDLCPTSDEMTAAMEAEIAEWRAHFAAAPAQPVGLSEQDRLDAARYRWLRANHETYVPEGDLPALWEHKKRNDYGMKSFDALDTAIDAILAAKEAP